MAESEAETPSTPGEFESKYFEFHGVRLPPFCRGKMEEIANFPVRPSDVWIVTYPKSVGYGSWFEHVQEFWEHRMDSNVLFLKYEDMHRDLVTMVEQLARFLGVSCDKAQLEALTEHCHQLVDQCCNAEALPVGRAHCVFARKIFLSW
ncbi:sulfotransferase 4A1 isoform X4 [Homo sapiens]|uniref:sulfotransferase 4A1 isoform X4 n=1 Tax=Homo sapiens TaxID=9606 RepID=UPI001FB05F4D|nr:sulfotransferase 4A1 isoform X4 [Homo sapiens]XP_054181483.1 sulfotransferase 4A1 isoform X4 [Homo sapiens]